MSQLLVKDDNGNIAPGGKQVLQQTLVALGSSATFTGEWFPVECFSSLQLLVLADQAGDAYIEYSMDGSTEFNEDTASIVASTPLTIDSTLECLYARMKIVNGITAQGSLAAYFIAKN